MITFADAHPMLHVKPETERQRRLRQRHRNGRWCVRVEIDDEIIGLLIDTRWLAIPESEDREAQGRAIAAMLRDAAAATRTVDASTDTGALTVRRSRRHEPTDPVAARSRRAQR